MCNTNCLCHSFLLTLLPCSQWEAVLHKLLQNESFPWATVLHKLHQLVSLSTMCNPLGTAAPVWNPHRVTCPARKSFLHKSIGPCQDLLPAWASEHENILYSCQLICSHSFVGSQYCFSHSLGFHYCVSL